MKKRWTFRPAGLALAAGVWVAFLGSGCGSKEQAGGADSSGRDGSPDESRIVLQVGPDAYSLGDFSRYVRETVGTGETDLNVAGLSHFFDRFIEEKLLLRAAADKGITVSPEDKQAYLEDVETGVLTEEEKTALLTSDTGPLIDQLKIETYTREITQDITVEEDEVRTYYDRNPGEFSLGERAQVSQILLPTEARAVEVWERARFADEAGFRGLAQTESVGPEAAEGGVMGVFQRGQLPVELEEAVFAMREGEVGPISESPYGFHIFRLDKKFEPERISFEDAAPAIRRKIVDIKAEAAMKRHLDELAKRLEWKSFPENLSFPYQRMK